MQSCPMKTILVNHIEEDKNVALAIARELRESDFATWCYQYRFESSQAATILSDTYRAQLCTTLRRPEGS